jgi:hypothetical protein
MDGVISKSGAGANPVSPASRTQQLEQNFVLD